MHIVHAWFNSNYIKGILSTVNYMSYRKLSTNHMTPKSMNISGERPLKSHGFPNLSLAQGHDYT